MASIDKRVGGRYRARWREFPGGPQKTRHFDRKVDAKHFLDGILGDLARGQYINPADGRMLFRDYAEEWRAAQMHRVSTAVQCEGYLRRHAYPALGHRPLGAIRRSEIQGWVKDRSEHLAPSSVELLYRWVSTIFKAAVGDRLIAASPCVRINLPKTEVGEIQPLEGEVVEALAQTVPARYRALIILAAGTGLRQGECFGLSVDRVDFLRRQVRVDRQLVSVSAGVPKFGPPKTAASFRTVPMPAVATEALADHLASFQLGPENLIFTNSFGTPLRRNAFGKVWHNAVAKLDLATAATFHDLRHFYASLLIDHGCSVKVVQRRLGHKSAMETLDTYSHLWPDNEDETRDAVDAALGSVPNPVASHR